VGEGPPSTPHMDIPLSSGFSPILLNSVLILSTPCPVQINADACGKGMLAACLSGGDGVKSRSPRKRVRQAQDLRPSPPLKQNGACHSATIGPAPARRLTPSDGPGPRPNPMLHVASCHINSYPVAAPKRLHQEPPYLGQRAGQTGPFFSYGLMQPVVDAVPCPGLRRADQARPNLVISIIA
jgi:hypothetical protein